MYCVDCIALCFTPVRYVPSLPCRKKQAVPPYRKPEKQSSNGKDLKIVVPDCYLDSESKDKTDVPNCDPSHERAVQLLIK